jgi:hypothetical protein
MSTISTLSRHREIPAFIDRAAELRFPNSFNPYADHCPDHDLAEGPQIRRDNLAAILTAAVLQGVDELWLALEPTWKGARRTGLAMTDERHLQAHALRWRSAPVERATNRVRSPREHTAGYVWGSLAEVPQRVFLWNAVPVHTHEPGDYRTNRRQEDEERDACIPLLKRLLNILQPAHCFAIGGDAQIALADAGRPCTTLTHPARRKRAFVEQVRQRHDLP